MGGLADPSRPACVGATHALSPLVRGDLQGRESGKLYVELPDGAIQLGPGEEHRVEPGVPHRPYNPTDEEVIIANDKPAMPQSFAACLVQIYHFLDAAEGQMGPGLMVRIAALDPICDGTLSEIPAVVRVGTEWLVVPFARVLGYKELLSGAFAASRRGCQGVMTHCGRGRKPFLFHPSARTRAIMTCSAG